MSITSIWLWILKNWQLYAALMLLLFVFATTGRLKKLFRDARKGFSDIFTFDGFIITCILCYLIYRIYLIVMG